MEEHLLLLFTMMNKEANAYYEFLEATQSTQIEVMQTIKTNSPGILILRVRSNEGVTRQLEETFRKNFWVFRSLLKVAVVGSTLSAHDEEGLRMLSSQLDSWVNGSKYRVTLHRVKNKESRNRIISLLTADIKASVDLENYEKEIIVYYVDSHLYVVFGKESELLTEKLEDQDSLDNNLS